MAVATEVTEDVALFLQTIYDVFGATGEWQHLDTLLDQEHDLDVEALLQEMPIGLLRILEPVRNDTIVALRVAGLVRCRGAEGDVELFLRTLRWCVARERSFRPASATASEQLRVTSEEMAADWRADGHEVSDSELVKAYAMLGTERLFAALGGQPREWELTLTREVIRPYRNVETVDGYLSLVAEREQPRATGRPIPLSWPPTYEEPRTGPPITATPAAADEATLRLSALHPRVRDACEQLFRGGHYRQGVLDAAMALRDLVRERSGLSEPDDSTLMGKGLGGKDPRITVADLSTGTGRNIQRGTAHLAQGVLARLRNPLTHEKVELPPAEAMEMVALISRVVRDVDAGELRHP